ncbi:MAG: 30S ribosomal protein S2 [Candidatus Nealsonbacteria bacterium]|nr:30S ribosomal protein S2 [Candidatus Nealsonbacteria bacterium]
MAILREEKEILAHSKNVSAGGDFQINADEMTNCGVHFGHRTSGSHPKMKPYVSGVRNSVNIIDLEKTTERLEAALKFIQGLISQNKILMIVGTKIQVKSLVKETGQELDLPYVNERWLGGTFSNFSVIKKRIDYFKDLERKKAEGELEKYTKKERADFDQELKKLEIKFGGLKKMDKLPDAVLLLDMKKDWVALEEVKQKKIKIIAIADTNVDPTLVDFPIPANDDALSSVRYILDKVKEVVKKAKKETKSEK